MGGGVVPDSQTDSRNYGGNKNELREQRRPKMQTQRVAEKGRNSGGIQLRNFAQKGKWRVFFTFSSFLSDFLKSTSSSSERSLKEGHSRVKVFLISKTRQGKSSLHFRDLSSGKSYFSPNIRLESILANDCCGTIFPWSRGEAWPANKQRKNRSVVVRFCGGCAG